MMAAMLSEADPFDIPQDEHGNVPPADLAEVAAQVRASAYVEQCRRLVEWVGTGRPVTPKQVLRLAPAREAYAASPVGVGAGSPIAADGQCGSDR